LLCRSSTPVAITPPLRFNPHGKRIDNTLAALAYRSLGSRSRSNLGSDGPYLFNVQTELFGGLEGGL
jgi:hypothetical protein